MWGFYLPWAMIGLDKTGSCALNGMCYNHYICIPYPCCPSFSTPPHITRLFSSFFWVSQETHSCAAPWCCNIKGFFPSDFFLTDLFFILNIAGWAGNTKKRQWNQPWSSSSGKDNSNSKKRAAKEFQRVTGIAMMENRGSRDDGEVERRWRAEAEERRMWRAMMINCRSQSLEEIQGVRHSGWLKMRFYWFMPNTAKSKARTSWNHVFPTCWNVLLRNLWVCNKTTWPILLGLISHWKTGAHDPK